MNIRVIDYVTQYKTQFLTNVYITYTKKIMIYPLKNMLSDLLDARHYMRMQTMNQVDYLISNTIDIIYDMI